MAVQIQTVQTQLPSRLLAETQALVKGGWFQSLDEVMASALRKFLDSHREELMEEFVREDVEWGLRGTD